MQITNLRTSRGFLLAFAFFYLLGFGKSLAQVTVVQSCRLTDFDVVGAFHSIYLSPIPGQSNQRYSFDSNGGLLTLFSDGSAQITGRVVNVANSNLQWNVDFWLENELDFNSWSALGRDVKVELAPPAVVTANQQNWLFWELDSLRSQLTGVAGTFYDGDTLQISHDPPNRQFGFQFGIGANAKNGNNGISGWFRFRGVYSGHGDINSNANCGTACSLGLTQATPLCESDSTFGVRVGLTGIGSNFEILDGNGISLLSNLSAGTYIVGPFPHNSAVSLTIRDNNQTACDTTIHGIVTDCTPIEECTLTDFDSVAAHSIYLFVYPGQTDPQYLFDANQGTLTTFADGSALITGRVINASNPNFQWDIRFWLVEQKDFATWSSLGRGVKVEQAPPAVVAANQQNWKFWEIDSLRSVMTGVPGTSLAGDTLFISHDPPNRQFGFQFGVGANAKNGGFGLSGWFKYTGSFSNHGDINVLAECGPVRNCDLQLNHAQAHCITDSTFEIQVNFSGTGNGYRISDTQGNVYFSGIGSGTYFLGPFSNGTIVDLIISDTTIANCDTTIVGLTEDCTPPPPVCDLEVLSSSVQCLNNNEFEVSIAIGGTGNNFILSDNQGSTVQSGGAGTYTFGPYANNTVVDIFVNDSSKANCDTTVVGLTQDCMPPCDLQLLSAIPSCISNSQFQVVVTFSGTGNGFVLTDNQGSPAQVGAAGTYTFGPYNNNTQVSISLSEPNIPNCDTTVTGLTQDCTPPCDLLLDSANAVCIS
ncbi:MAG: hypothetical protein MRZ79_04010, partial [Bacteroidia bacterium]|nr:hypothetical protein [Bacteroidia bacterium]